MAWNLSQARLHREHYQEDMPSTFSQIHPSFYQYGYLSRQTYHLGSITVYHIIRLCYGSYMSFSHGRSQDRSNIINLFYNSSGRPLIADLCISVARETK
ncbi:hypothetical protein LB507_000200 [Fusarium sp. FIESC RH6]|nr:hypothetical protein LB507_000200 [Fusarium sp. FIESC RH6]